MKRTWIVMVCVLVLVVTVAGCKKKPPEIAPVMDTTETPPPVKEVKPAPAPVVKDEKPSWWSEDLQEMTSQLYRQGLLGDVYFDFDKYDLKPDARDRLEKNAAFMRSNPALDFMLEGHCDERGTNEYNLALGARRASAAKNYLVSLGVDESRLRTISYGEERPQCTVSNESCWQQNRRAHFIVTNVRAAG